VGTGSGGLVSLGVGPIQFRTCFSGRCCHYGPRGRPVVLGQVQEILPDHKARILLLTDPFSALSAQVGSTGEQGLVEGRGGSRLLLNYLYADSKVQPGDEVVTAGLGGVYPAHLLVGQVTDVVDPIGASSKRAAVSPAARLGFVRDVLILSPQKENSGLGKQGHEEISPLSIPFLLRRMGLPNALFVFLAIGITHPPVASFSHTGVWSQRANKKCDDAWLFVGFVFGCPRDVRVREPRVALGFHWIHFGDLLQKFERGQVWNSTFHCDGG
jgi:hypothetical protein